MSFNITTAWNGTREVLGRTRSYHDTLHLPDAPEREKKCGKQDAAILRAMQMMRTATPSEVHTYFAGAYLLTSVRRSMTNLTERGRLRKLEQVPGPCGSPETRWMFCGPTTSTP
jgi:hypothetical protein